MKRENILELAERCRRLATQTNDGQMRNSLEALAQEYESQLPRAERGGPAQTGGDGCDGTGASRGFTPRTRH